MNRPSVEDLFREHRVKLVALAKAKGVQWADAEDVVQDAFLVALRDYGDDIQNPIAWLRKIVRLGVVRLAEHANRRAKPSSDLLENEVFASRADTDHGSTNGGLCMADPDTALYVMAALQELQPARRRALEMWAIEGRSTGEIASELGISKRSAEAYCNGSLKALRLS